MQVTLKKYTPIRNATEQQSPVSNNNMANIKNKPKKNPLSYGIQHRGHAHKMGGLHAFLA